MPYLSISYDWYSDCDYTLGMFKIRRSGDAEYAIFVLSGRIEEKHVVELGSLLDAEATGTQVTLDLEEVKLVDRGAIRFLAACESRGIRLNNCPSYIRKWIEQGSDTGHEA